MYKSGTKVTVIPYAVRFDRCSTSHFSVYLRVFAFNGYRLAIGNIMGNTVNNIQMIVCVLDTSFYFSKIGGIRNMHIYLYGAL
jgi:hypothetical protein